VCTPRTDSAALAADGPRRKTIRFAPPSRWLGHKFRAADRTTFDSLTDPLFDSHALLAQRRIPVEDPPLGEIIRLLSLPKRKASSSGNCQSGIKASACLHVKP
jgi:hypothetical protein